ncbi:Piso0_005088 [Millerozyma farinosa CBS 7064]|uniref:Piso0_005088 protein n=1 Tax=Pichia sorbitophila (strain ATCC MYA-4447 / BCRC 22081 / CBS 7064 / NBRC 10061 / NRRL Y-12695) TaxID=559304 RepID=G8Y188_PICSO|nr:Piso0_005088 [Millerozyma farinosa CBS 7064]
MASLKQTKKENQEASLTPSNAPIKESSNDQRKLIEIISSYRNWHESRNSNGNVMVKPSVSERERSGSSRTAIDYVVLKALEEMTHDLSAGVKAGHRAPLDRSNGTEPLSSGRPRTSSHSSSRSSGLSMDLMDSFLNESEIEHLRSKITEVLNTGQIKTSGNKSGQAASSSLEESDLGRAYEDLSPLDFDGQDDYDLDEIDENFQYQYPATRHIEVELNTENEHTTVHLDRAGNIIPVPPEGSGRRADEDLETPSCEFTFEYDSSGKLVPVYSNVEQKLREMYLQRNASRHGGGAAHELDDGDSGLLESETDSHSNPQQSSKKKKKKKKKKGRNTSTNPEATEPDAPHRAPRPTTPSAGYCLLCEYELIFGSKPHQMMKWYDKRVLQEEQKRTEIKRKLERAKSRALKKQKELRQMQSRKHDDSLSPNNTDIDSEHTNSL